MRECVHGPRESGPARNHVWSAVSIGSTRSSEEQARNSRSNSDERRAKSRTARAVASPSTSRRSSTPLRPRPNVADVTRVMLELV